MERVRAGLRLFGVWLVACVLLQLVVAAGLFASHAAAQAYAGSPGVVPVSPAGAPLVASGATTAAAMAISLREATDQVSLGTTASPCLNAGTTASSASVTAGTWMMLVSSEAVSVCMAPDANCDAGVIDWAPGTQLPIVVTATNVGTWYCRSAGGTGVVSLRKVN